MNTEHEIEHTAITAAEKKVYPFPPLPDKTYIPPSRSLFVCPWPTTDARAVFRVMREGLEKGYKEPVVDGMHWIYQACRKDTIWGMDLMMGWGVVAVVKECTTMYSDDIEIQELGRMVLGQIEYALKWIQTRTIIEL